MSTFSLSNSIITRATPLSLLPPSPLSISRFPHLHPPPTKPPSRPCLLSSSPIRKTLVFCTSSEEAAAGVSEDEWLKKLPEKKKPLYAHSLPCVEAWLKQLGFRQSRDDRAAWFVQKLDWHAQLNLDATDLYIRYLKSRPGNLEKDIERRFSYALSREDIENAILGGP